jgi:hypothetical protein
MTVIATKMPAERFRVSIVSGEKFPGPMKLIYMVRYSYVPDPLHDPERLIPRMRISRPDVR